MQKLLSLIRFHLSIFAFVAIAFGILSVPVSGMVLPRFSSRVFRIWDFTFKTLIYLELIFVYGGKERVQFQFPAYG